MPLTLLQAKTLSLAKIENLRKFTISRAALKNIVLLEENKVELRKTIFNEKPCLYVVQIACSLILLVVLNYL